MTPQHDLASILATAIKLVNAPMSEAVDIVRLGSARYRLIAEHKHGIGWIVVLKQEASEATIRDKFLTQRFGLTRREVQVARLLMDRYSNKEIGRSLNITASTAGRHAERVLKKLGVASRRDVRSKLLAEAGGRTRARAEAAL